MIIVDHIVDDPEVGYDFQWVDDTKSNILVVDIGDIEVLDGCKKLGLERLITGMISLIGVARNREELLDFCNGNRAAHWTMDELTPGLDGGGNGATLFLR